MKRNETSINAVQNLQPGDLTTVPEHHIPDRSDRSASRGILIKSGICLCCGEPMSQSGNALSRNPNLCASCSSMADGMEEEKNVVKDEGACS